MGNILYKEAVIPELLHLAEHLCSLDALKSFRIVGGTAIALQLGHRKSIDIDFFSNEVFNKTKLTHTLQKEFPNDSFDIKEDSIQAFINNVKIELFDDWHTKFNDAAMAFQGIRLASLNDLAAFKLEAITGRREKKDYIDLYFLFKQLGAQKVLHDFPKYNPHLTLKSILFALGELPQAAKNKSVMPEMIKSISWPDIHEFISAQLQLFLDQKQR